MTPDLFLDFARSQRLDPRITFTRNSIGTYYDDAGILKTAPINQPRFEFDPTTGLSKGLLMEESRTNLLTRSSEFADAAWVPEGVGTVTVTANTTTAPDNSVTADTLIAGATTGGHNLFRSSGITIVAGSTFTTSIYAKAKEFSKVRLRISTSSNGHEATYDLITGTISAASAIGSGSIVSSSMTQLPSGWWRLSITRKIDPAGVSVNPRIGLIDNSGNVSYAGDGVSGIYVWGAQFEVGAFPTSHIPTTTATVQRASELALITGENFSSWYNQTEGTLLAQFDAPTTGVLGFPRIIEINDNTSSAGLLLFFQTNGIRFAVNFGGEQSNIVHFQYPANTVTTSVCGYKLNDCAHGVSSIYSNAFDVDTSVLIPTVTQMCIGNRHDRARPWNGHISRLIYWGKRFSNTDLRTLVK